MLKSNEANKPETKNSREFRFFKKITAIPYLLVVLAFLMPLATISCADGKVIADPTVYELASGINLEEELRDPALGLVKKMASAGNAESQEQFRKEMKMPNYPKMEPVPVLYAVVVGAVLAGAFAWVTSLGSLIIGLLTLLSTWGIYFQLGAINTGKGMAGLKLEPGVGLYAASALIVIGSAMNIASLLRPIVDDIKVRRAASKSK